MQTERTGTRSWLQYGDNGVYITRGGTNSIIGTIITTSIKWGFAT